MTTVKAMANIIARTTKIWFKKLELKSARKAKVRRTMKELSQLTDKELNDIGINRYDIPRIAGGYKGV
jgi:uncharacterized protein YjiS (DUF1127 family)